MRDWHISRCHLNHSLLILITMYRDSDNVKTLSNKSHPPSAMSAMLELDEPQVAQAHYESPAQHYPT